MTRIGSLGVVGARLGLLQLVGDTMIDLIGPMLVHRGDALALRLTITDDEDERVDITGATIELQVKANLGDADPPTIAKAVGTGITLLTQSGDTLGQADIAITGGAAGDTDKTPGLYWLDVVLVLAGARAHVVAPREFTIGPVVNAP